MQRKGVFTMVFADGALLAAAISPRADAKMSLRVGDGSRKAVRHVFTISSTEDPALAHSPLPPASATAVIIAPAEHLLLMGADLSFKHRSAAFKASVCRAVKLRSELPRALTTAATSLRAIP